MALTATFQADFSAFHTAVEKATVTLKEMKSGAGDVEKSLNKLAESYSGKAIIAQAEAELAGKGRLVIRPSGTEPVIRVMAEGEDEKAINKVVNDIAEAKRAQQVTQHPVSFAVGDLDRKSVV